MLLSVTNVGKSFGVDEILSDVTFRLDAHEKVAMVGRNGTGKTTLLKILTGQLEPDNGFVRLLHGAAVGYLRQEAPLTGARTVLDEAQSAVAHQIEVQRKLQELEARMEAGVHSDEDLEEYALLQEHFLDASGYSIERDVRVVLQRMGFTEDEFDKPASKLSGGEKTRLAIAKLLLEEPDLLILDEPTNHLDLQATEWLESWVRGYHGAVLLVSHDRAFLDNTAQRVLEMKDGTVKSYPGPFPKYLELKAIEEERQAIVAKRQEQEIAKLDEFVRRFMNSQRTAQARGRLKMMNKLIATKVEAPKDAKGMKAGFAVSKRSGDIVAETSKLTIGFPPDATLVRDLDWTVRVGERWGVIGENGSGKSTLIKTLLGVLEPLAGKARLGSNVIVGYFSQDTEDLDIEMSPLETLIWDLDMEPQPARDLLGRFLFSGDDVYRPIRTLSGGEKNKMSLAKLTQLNPNLLILDEPTNHLDMSSREALATILKEFSGTLVLISHDRWLLSQVTDQTLDLRKSGAIVYYGSYPEYRRRSEARSSPQPKPKAGAAASHNSAAAEPPKPILSPRERSKEIQRMAKFVEEAEALVAGLEAKIKEIEVKLASVGPTEDVYGLTLQYQAAKERLDGAISAWEEQSRVLEELSAE